MKKKLLFFTVQIMLLACLIHPLFAQTENLVGFHYKVQVETPIYECDLTGKRISDDLYEAPRNSSFTYIGLNATADSVIIRFWLWKDDDAKIMKYNFTDDTKTQKAYFLMSKTDFSTKAIRRYGVKSAFTVGTAALPFKIRSNPFLFTNDVAIGTVVGVKRRLSPYTDSNFFNVLTGFGISSVSLDSISTQGNITSTSAVTNPAALTVSLGAVFEFSQVQVGVFAGLDYINNNKSINWDYQGSPWISIGLGYSLFTKSNKNATTDPGINTASGN